MKFHPIIIPAALAGLFTFSSFSFADMTMGIKRQTLPQAWAWQEAHYDVSWYQDTEPEEYTVDSYDGYRLHAVLLHSQAAPSSDRYVICSHGYTDNRYGTLKYAKLFLDLGFHVIAYDLRGHGENEKTFCTYSIRESKDLACLIEDSCRRYGEDITLGLHGESLGAATTVSVLKNTQRPAFAIADCGFADILNVLKGGLKAMNPLLPPMVYPASLAAKIKYGYAFTDMTPIDALKDNQVPILFLHGAADTFILPENSERMNRASGGYTEFHLIPGAAHAESVLKEPVLYQNYVADFLKKLEKQGDL